MNTVDGFQRPLSALTLDGLDAYSTATGDVTTAYIQADTVLMNGYIAADMVVAANATAALTAEVNSRVASVGTEATTRAAQDTSITSAFIAADTVVTNARIAGDTAVTSAFIAADTVVTSAYIAADAVVTNASVQKAGGTMTGSLTMSGGNINMGTGYIGLLAGTNPTDAVNKGQMDAADATKLPLLGGTMGGVIQMGNFNITNLAPATSNLHAVNYQQISTGSIPRTTYNSGEVINRVTIGPATGMSFASTVYAPTANGIPLLVASFAATLNNLVVVHLCFSLSASGYGEDLFTVYLSLGQAGASSVQTFLNYLLPITGAGGARNQVVNIKAVFKADSTAVRDIWFTFQNNSANDTITLNNTNWYFSVEHMQA